MNIEKIDKLLSNLDNEQKTATMAPFNPTLVRAVAGSGKTRVLTHRVAYTIENGHSPSSMLLLTFTNKASREMLNRIKTLLGRSDLGVKGGTFHSVGARELRETAHHIGYSSNFSIIDPLDARNLIDRILVRVLKECGLKKSEFPNKKVIYGLYSSAINLNKSINEINEKLTEFEVDTITKIIKEYIHEKKNLNLMDFDDLILNFMKVLKIDSVREALSNKYKFVFCDEYQDINWIQNRILQLLNLKNQTLFVVGDLEQSIYGWRGSSVSHIENFTNEYENASSYDITYNYRSKPPILALAEESINNNYPNEKKHVTITPFLNGGNKPTYKSMSEWNQIDYIVDKIHEYRRAGIPFKEMAMLIRTNFLSRGLEKALKQNNIPYQLISGFSFFERMQVKDLNAFLRIIENTSDETAYVRALCLFDGIKITTALKIFNHIKSFDYRLESIKTFKTTKKNKDGVEQFYKTLSMAKEFDDVVDILESIVNNFYRAHLKNTEDDALDRMQDVDFMIESALKYEDISSFLTDMTLSVEDDEILDEPGVVLTTYHKAKGLEWDVVFMPYVANGTIPMSLGEIAEERRLFYVGVTRAKKQLIITHIPHMPITKKELPESDFITELKYTEFDDDLPDLSENWINF